MSNRSVNGKTTPPVICKKRDSCAVKGAFSAKPNSFSMSDGTEKPNHESRYFNMAPAPTLNKIGLAAPLAGRAGSSKSAKFCSCPKLNCIRRATACKPIRKFQCGVRISEYAKGIVTVWRFSMPKISFSMLPPMPKRLLKKGV
ncbi:MAG: hypothetical protein RL757_305 [Bacteroidota bacterium]